MGEILWVLWEGWRDRISIDYRRSNSNDRYRAKGENTPGGVSDDGNNCRGSNDFDRLSRLGEVHWRLWCAVMVDDRRRAKGENGPGGVSDDGSNCRDSNDLDRLSSVVSSSSSGRGGGGQRQGQEGKEGLDKCPVRILIQIFLDRESNFVSNIWAWNSV